MALSNLVRLTRNPYPGRGIVIGRSQDDQNAVQIYWIMGRSENSRNRVFKHEGDRLFTEAADPSKVKDPSLIIYNAMDKHKSDFVVSNGDQTDTVIQAFKRSHRITFAGALRGRHHEPDQNFTPRISGLSTIYPGECFTELHIIRKSTEGETDHHACFGYERGDIHAGYGYCLTTYMGDGNPLPSFVGPPYAMPIHGEIDDVAKTYWSALNEDNRVSLAVKFIDLISRTSKIVIINRFHQVEVATV
jgi:IMP cyclohydrolase